MSQDQAAHEASVRSTNSATRLLKAVFVASLACSALLMFLVQPMVGKTVLPALGGTPQVWNTCMVFFQAMLFLGYLHAHFTGQWLGARRQALVHLALALLALALIPFGVSPERLSQADATHPIPWLMQSLLLSVGLPVFVLSATAPLLQKWFARSRHPQAQDPYFLYVASNIGSLLALLAYPAFVEPLADLDRQWLGWSAGFTVLVLLMLGCAAFLRDSLAPQPVTAVVQPTEAAPGLARRLRWLLLSFAPSSLLLGVTTFITTDIAPMPLFWVVPLALYLLTFIMAFASRPLLSLEPAMRIQALLVILLVVLSLLPFIAGHAAGLSAALHLAVFSFTALVCHAELVRLRPSADHLTEFYLWLSLGGLLGGAFNALLAPVLFSTLFEYPLVLALACALRPTDTGRPSTRQRLLDLLGPALLLGLGYAAIELFGALRVDSPKLAVGTLAVMLAAAGMLLLSFSARPMRFGLGVGLMLCVLVGSISSARERLGDKLMSARSFFGTYSVYRNEAAGVMTFVHGNTVHGVQMTDKARSRELASYYHSTGPFGDLFRALGARAEQRPVAIVGLGIGALACNAVPGSQWTFYEIDPLVEQVARDERYFSLLRDCAPTARVVIGDARLTLRGVPDHSLSVIVVDAFTSDSIPTHLLTREAIAGYRRKLAPDGLLALHISNRHLNLAPVIGNLAHDAGMVGRINKLLPPPAQEPLAYTPAQLTVLAADERALAGLAGLPHWVPLPRDPGTRPWSDSYINILRVAFPPKRLQAP